MRTILTLDLDDDVAEKLKAAAKVRSFRVVVNEALRAGPSVLETGVAVRKPHRTSGLNLGHSRVGSFDSVEEVLSRFEGDTYK